MVKRTTTTLAFLVLGGVVSAGCSSAMAPDDGTTVESTEALGNGVDHKFWLDSNFPGSKGHKMYGATWYDSDMPWATGSIVRLPIDSKYIGNIYAKVQCTNGTTAEMRSPKFEATVGGVTRTFIFNHLRSSGFT